MNTPYKLFEAHQAATNARKVDVALWLAHSIERRVQRAAFKLRKMR
jgi:hypothetical protein